MSEEEKGYLTLLAGVVVGMIVMFLVMITNYQHGSHLLIDECENVLPRHQYCKVIAIHDRGDHG